MQIVEYQVCRGCLATDTSMHDTRQHTASDFTRLVELLPTSKLGLPPCVCYECLAQLTKMRDFHAKNRRAYNVLLKIIVQKGRIEDTDIKQIDRTQQSLTSPLKYHQIESISIEPKRFCSDSADEDGKDGLIPELTDIKDDFKIELPQKEKIKNESWFVGFNNFSDDEDVGVTTTDTSLDNKAEKANVKKTDQKKVETKRKNVKNVNICMPKSRKRKTSQENSKPEPGAEAQKRPKVRMKITPGEKPTQSFFTEEYHSFATLTVMTEEERLEVFKQRSEKQQYIDADYKCTDCFYGFQSPESYDKHLEKHSPKKGAYVCPLCKRRFETQRLQAKHISVEHRTKFECKKCPYVCTTAQQAKNHSEKHTSVIYRCEKCNFKCSHELTYELHVRRMHEEATPCPCCGVSFLGRSSMHTHLSSAHPNRGLGRKRFRCKCEALFYNSEALKLHQSTSSKHNPDGSILLCCALCDSRFTEKQSLQEHMHTHPEEQKKTELCSTVLQTTKITCDECGEVLSGRRAHRLHYSRVHNTMTCPANSRYPDMLCDICGKIIRGIYSLRAHRFSHTGLRPYSCKICSKTFAQHIHLLVHMNTHTKGKIYKCRVCGKGFNQNSNRDRHLLVHTQERKISCDICGKSFKSRTHMFSHTRYVHMNKPWPKRDRSKRKPTQQKQYTEQESSD